MALSILTLGIYSAWAKVRTKRYFYGNTFLDGSSFEYHGDPISILTGRLIVCFFVGLYMLFSHFAQIYSEPIGYIVPGVFFIFVFPWLFVSAMAFNLRNSSYRGVHFSYFKNYKESYKIFCLYGFISMVTLWLGYPLLEYKQKQMMVNNSRFGQQKMSFLAQARHYWNIWGITAGLYTLLSLLFIFFFLLFSFVFKIPENAKLLFAGMGFIFGVLIFFMILAFIQAKKTNLLWNKTNMGDITFISNQQVFTLCKIHITNILATMVTFGLARPWTLCRLARYHANTMKVFVKDENGLDKFINCEDNQNPSAIADAGDDFLDFDIGVW